MPQSAATVEPAQRGWPACQESIPRKLVVWASHSIFLVLASHAIILPHTHPLLSAYGPDVDPRDP
ncbi:uncharacterized protein BO88DRAFT_399757 [Aspergillus vadensis CBS 113365]|uniref:Uncharacterized protein n=1 Tax=Aspergillus vadensis (strain CBS 113365 / IMI 142717 / IBT 24658) TaxID=1448311 RepID=A0A319BS72_ASPVC|nr:hypothetical protein BO88DRAFT_399757 [Aspergillus vadensis CBS 113365]PYH74070.1 hypothetical protein BO88DRAFT_399757 [Aspergillus vadensis CBS 113365]